MSLLYYFIFSHFLGDFTFQPHWLFHFKKRSFWGALLHAVIIGLTMAFVLIPYLYDPKVGYAIVAISIIHLALDYFKTQWRDHYPQIREIWLYVVDQGLHLLSIALIYTYAVGNVAPQPLPLDLSVLYHNPWLMAYLLTLVLVTYFYDVTRYVLSEREKRFEYQRDYYGMLLRATFLTMGFVMVRIATVI